MRPQQTALITGGNSGLGYQCALHIARQPGWQVVLACRNAHKAEAAAEQIRRATGNPAVTVLLLDLASLRSIRRGVTAFQQAAYPPLKALIGNAGLMELSRMSFTEDGYETTFAVNHLGHFLLTQLLCPSMPADGRIVLVSSAGHDPSQQTDQPAPTYQRAQQLAFPAFDANADPETVGRINYVNSKLCNVLYTYSLTDQLRHAGRTLSVLAFDPGGMPRTGLVRDWPASKRFLVNWIMPVLAPLLRVMGYDLRTTTVSGKALAEIAVGVRYHRVTGQYVNHLGVMPSSPDSYDKAKQDDLYQTSLRLTGLVTD